MSIFKRRPPVDFASSHASAHGDVSVVLLSTESLHAEPSLSKPETFAGPDAIRLGFGSDGPLLSVAPRALDLAVGHVSGYPSVESGGLCLGRVFRDERGRLLISFEEIVPAEETPDGVVQGPASLTFTPQAWGTMIGVCQTRFSSLRVLGWYHSHPGFGVFLSSMDLFIHRHFFSAPWHLAMVIDPKARQAGFFCRSQDTLLVNGVRWGTSVADATPLPFRALRRSARMTKLSGHMS